MFFFVGGWVRWGALTIHEIIGLVGALGWFPAVFLWLTPGDVGLWVWRDWQSCLGSQADSDVWIILPGKKRWTKGWDLFTSRAETSFLMGGSVGDSKWHTFGWLWETRGVSDKKYTGFPVSGVSGGWWNMTYCIFRLVVSKLAPKRKFIQLVQIAIFWTNTVLIKFI